jgi:hypothetical protein
MTNTWTYPLSSLIQSLLLVTLVLVVGSQAAEPRIAIVHSTDLCHPHDDPDDHYDLACLFALNEFDIKGIVLDLGEHQAERPGRPAVEQMMHITGRKAPYAIGLDRPLRNLDDKALEAVEKFQGGVQLILSVLRDAEDKVVLHTTGSCRDVAAAFNREPELFRRKVRAIYMEIGTGPDGNQDDYNVVISPLAYARLLESGLPVYWCPCVGKDGYSTWYHVDESAVVGACTRRVQNYFVYCLTQSKDAPIAFLNSGPHPLPSGIRNMWCTAPMFHAAGRKIYQRGDDDFVALSPRDAEKAGLGAKAVDVYEFVPVQVKVASLPQPGDSGQKPSPLSLSAKLNPPKAMTFVFRATSPRYERVVASCLKNLLSELGR